MIDNRGSGNQGSDNRGTDNRGCTVQERELLSPRLTAAEQSVANHITSYNGELA